jgi:hypothetical protein
MYESYSSADGGILKKVNATHEVKLYMGSRVGYDGSPFVLEQVTEVVGIFQMKSTTQMPIRFTPTLYVDGDYEENGWELATLAYPGKLFENDVIEDFMFGLAKHLIKEFQQKRITVVTPTYTYMFEDTGNGRRL